MMMSIGSWMNLKIDPLEKKEKMFSISNKPLILGPVFTPYKRQIFYGNPSIQETRSLLKVNSNIIVNRKWFP